MPGVSPMVKWLLIFHGAVWGICVLLSFAGGRDSDGPWRTVSDLLALSPDVWRAWFPFVPVWQLVTYGALHSVADPGHILMNMLILYFLGGMLEEVIGARRFLVTYVAGILVGGLAVLAIGLAMGKGAPTLGASGGVFTIVVALAMLRPNQRIIFMIIPITLKTLALVYVGLNVFGFLQEVFKGASAGVSYSAHLGGALWGFLAVKRQWIWKDPVAELETKRARRATQQAVDVETRVDELLVKISKEGIQSLSAREKAFLNRASNRSKK